MSVSTALFRVYRPILLPFAAIILVVELVIVSLVASTKDLDFSMWLVLGGSAAKYWLFVVGVMLVAMQLRQFVTNGVTRHEFLAGLAVFGLVLSAAFAAAVVLGHGLEGLLLSGAGKRAANYPVPGLVEFARTLPETSAYLVSGVLIAAGFYRWRPRIGLAVMVAGILPAGVADALLGFDEFGRAGGPRPLAVALPLSLAVTALGVLAVHRVLGDVPIRRTAG
jgi:hypothetical protein